MDFKKEYEKLGFYKTMYNSYVSNDDVTEIFEDDDGSWSYSVSICGGYWTASGEGYETAVKSIVAAGKITPSDDDVHDAIARAFDELSDDKKLAVTQEIELEHCLGFEFADVYDPSDVISHDMSKDELIKIILSGAIRNDSDPVRFDIEGNIEQVTYEKLYEEMECYRDDIVDNIVYYIEQGSMVECVPDFESVMQAFEDGTWKD